MLTQLFASLIVGTVVLAMVHSAGAAEPQLAHIVYFKLKDSSDAAKEKLLGACHKYLTGHDGTIYFSVGTLVPDLEREVNQRDWDVALHVVFKNRAAHDAYQVHPRHKQFIEENRENWEKVKVYDAYVSPAN
jgi:hypothetical protein